MAFGHEEGGYLSQPIGTSPRSSGFRPLLGRDHFSGILCRCGTSSFRGALQSARADFLWQLSAYHWPRWFGLLLFFKAEEIQALAERLIAVTTAKWQPEPVH